MRCPFCHEDHDRVIDTRTGDDGFVIRRRRHCLDCGKRFTTYERVETTTIRVVKRDGTRIPFDRKRLKEGLERACWKRPISDAQLETLIAQVETEVESLFDSEVDSHFIGEMVMKLLRELDQVAYVRFASVYRKFQDARDFVNEAQPMLDNASG